MEGFTVAAMDARDAGEAARLLRLSLDRGETLYKPVPAEEFAARFLGEGRVCLGAYADGKMLGFAHAAYKTRFLPGEDAENTPLCLTLLVTAPEHRGQGVAAKLLEALRAQARRMGKSRVAVCGDNPQHMAWLIPGADGHDHNNAPGVWEDGPGFAFLQAQGFEILGREIAMYRALADFERPDGLDAQIARLAAEGIRVGRWTPECGCAFEGMCKRVGSAYWHHVLAEELAAWREGRPNGDPEHWADGKRPAGPRTLLTATTGGEIVGFTGPVDLQESGRGFFTGICTDPLYAGRGIATALFSLLLCEFKAEGAAFCSLFTGRENPAQRIYLRAGLRAVAPFAEMAQSVRD